MPRTWNERRHHRKRVMSNRRFVAKNVFDDIPPGSNDDGKILNRPEGFYDKQHFGCSCPMCKGERYNRRKAKKDERFEKEEAWD